MMKKNIQILFLLVISMLTFSCVNFHKCKTIECKINKPINSLTQQELNNLLKEARSSEYNITHYWIPTMKKIFEMKRKGDLKVNIPQEDLKFFLTSNYTNKIAYYEYYNYAVFLWFNQIINGKKTYTSMDKKFLQKYIYWCLNELCSKYQKCKCVDTVRNISSTLDSDLYDKFFK